MFDKKENYNITLPPPIPCPNCYEKSGGLSKLVPLFVREATLSEKMVVIWKCSFCDKEIR